MLVTLLAGLLAAQAPDSVRPDPRPSEPLKAALWATARELRKSETGRRLLALTEDLKAVERPRRPGPPIVYQDGVLLVDADRAPALSALEWEFASVRERWRAAARLPAAVLDGDMAAGQAVLEHALEKAEADPEFAAALRAATAQARRLLEARRGAVFHGEPPADALGRLAYELYLFSEDPYLFYRHAAPGPGPTFDEAAAFLDRHGDALARVEWRGGFAVLEGRMYPAGPARVAAALGRDGLRRLGERLGDFRGRPRETLTRKVNRWLRSTP